MKNMKTLILTIFLGALVVITTSGFECASTGLMSAKTEYSQKEYSKARALLEVEVRKNPKNEEAWYYLALTVQQQHDHFRVAEACDSAELAGSEYHQKIEILRQNEWVDTWNAAVTLLPNTEGNPDSLKKAEMLFKAAYRLDTSDPEPLRLLGSVYWEMKDTDRTLEAYKLYINITDANVQKGLDAGLMLQEPEHQLMSDFSSPDMRKSLPTSDSVKMFVYHSKAIRVFTAVDRQAGGSRNLIGWQFYSDKSTTNTNATPDNIDQVVRISAEAYNMVGNIYYIRGSTYMLQQSGAKGADSSFYYNGYASMDSALPYLMTAQRLKPENEDASRLLSEIYLRTNQLAKATASYQALINKFPTNKATHLNYGVLLLKQNEYQNAVNQFQDALKIDPNFNQALNYIAIAYKNWSADEQETFRKSGKKENDADRDKYLSKLKKSAEYFEKLHTLAPGDFAPLGQLGEIYSILQDADKLQMTLSALEAMESSQSDNPAYWNTLGTMYTVLNDVTKAKSAFDKMEALQKK